MKPKGWVKIERKIFYHHIFNDEPFSKRDMWNYLITHAAHTDYYQPIGTQKYLIRRGEITFSLSFLAKKAKWSIPKLRNFLKLLKEENMVMEQSRLYRSQTHLSICKYDRYQFPEHSQEHSQCATNTKNYNINNSNEGGDIAASLVTPKRKKEKVIRDLDVPDLRDYTTLEYQGG